eukprot:TRINITY_DN66658_c1_g4_i1.p1 TRINITY_DN66658_c1_g4~~TRINITY_DN66658_c1_g4_i1.p1  ORF type:complete len:731 (+),score=30.81 TRINITY_DN66658_c1_g4_i1:52-2244(+)
MQTFKPTVWKPSERSGTATFSHPHPPVLPPLPNHGPAHARSGRSPPKHGVSPRPPGRATPPLTTAAVVLADDDLAGAAEEEETSNSTSVPNTGRSSEVSLEDGQAQQTEQDELEIDNQISNSIEVLKETPVLPVDGKWTIISVQQPLVLHPMLVRLFNKHHLQQQQLRRGSATPPSASGSVKLSPQRYYSSCVLFTQYCVPPAANPATHPPECTLKIANTSKPQLLYWKLGNGAVPFRIISHTFTRSGFRQTNHDRKWNVLWAKRVSPEEYTNMEWYQKVNHIPGTWGIGRKDSLWRNIARMRSKFGAQEFGFVPQSYILPNDFRTFAQDFRRHGGGTYIVKPCASACGRGIRLLNKLPNPAKYKNALVQKYIEKPFLINNRKFDLRLYVVVTSFDPLSIYIFDKGLVRFATEPYTGPNSKLRNKFVHLTNVSINTKNAAYAPNTDANCSNENQMFDSSKWNLQMLQRWIDDAHTQGHDLPPWDTVWSNIHSIIIKTFILIEHNVYCQCQQLLRDKHSHCCFELFGFDIILDSNLRPYVLEANIMPSLCPSSSLDHSIKADLISNMLTLCGVRAYDRKRLAIEDERKRSQRLLHQTKHKTMSAPLPHNQSTLVQIRSAATMDELFSMLSSEDKDLILYCEEELARRGNFERIFPTGKTMDRYGHLFETPHHNNVILSRWEELKDSVGLVAEEKARPQHNTTATTTTTTTATTTTFATRPLPPPITEEMIL